MSENQTPALFEQPGAMQTAASDAAAVARATQEIQAALVIAQRYPRDEVAVIKKITQACQRKDLAEVAEYEYSRGGTRITGPTIDLLRAIANRWRNIRYGWSEVDRRDGQSLVRCFAWDMETNSQAERTFAVKHWRDTQSGGYALDDERDIYELLANMAARRVRACLEEVIDSDIVRMAVDVCRVTLKTGEKTPLRDRAARMLVEFQAFGVTQGMIEGRLGNKLDAISENQLASLRRVWKSLSDGVGKREDYFKAETAKPEFPGTETPPPSTQGASGVTTPPPAPEKPASKAPAPKAPPANDPPPVQETPETGSHAFNPLKAVRNLAKMENLPEGWILEFLAELGATDGSCTSLEEAALQNSNALKAVADSWQSTVKRIKDAHAAAKK